MITTSPNTKTDVGWVEHEDMDWDELSEMYVSHFTERSTRSPAQGLLQQHVQMLRLRRRAPHRSGACHR